MKTTTTTLLDEDSPSSTARSHGWLRRDFLRRSPELQGLSMNFPLLVAGSSPSSAPVFTV